MNDHHAMQEIAAAIPTTRHAELLFTAAADTLGERAWRLDRGKTSALYTRDPDRPQLIAPWPLVVFRDGEHTALGTLEIEVERPYGLPAWQPEPEPEPADADPPASRLRGQRRAELTIGWGQALRIRYDDSGDLIDISQVQGGATADFGALLETTVASIRTGRGLLGVADHIAGLDASARGPARLLPADGDGDAQVAWRLALRDLRRAVWTRRLPGGPCWIGVVVGDETTADWSRDPDDLLARLAPRADGSAVAVTRLPDEPERPAPYIEAGFRRWVPLLGGCGVVSHALARDEPGTTTLVGQTLLSLDPAEIIERLDAIEADAPPVPIDLQIAAPPDAPPLRLLTVGASFGDAHEATSHSYRPEIDGDAFDGDQRHCWAYRFRDVS